MERQNTKPAHEIQIGTVKADIWADIWAHAVPSGIRHSVTFAKLFEESENSWGSLSNFNRDDLLALVKIADTAFDWISANQKKEPAE